MNHIIFDFDGVLADTFDFHLNKINSLFNIDITPDEYRDVHNGNFYATPLEKMKKFKKHEYLDLVSYEQSQLPFLSEARNVLEYLKKQYSMHIISSGWERQILPFLQNHKIEHHFSEILCADHGLSKSEKFNILFMKHNIKPTECLFITDTLGDIREARAVNVHTVAVTFGFHPQKTLAEGHPAYLVHSWAEVQKAVDTHFQNHH